MDKQREYPFEFSVIMAVYNVAPFLREAVNGLIIQDFDFKRIQLIMVDDGSTDNSGVICDEYAQQYPKNVKVVHKQRGGLASARNAGLAYLKGQYVIFADAHGCFAEKTFSAVHSFFSEHEGETDVVVVRTSLPHGVKRIRDSEQKFQRRTRVADLQKDPYLLQLDVNNAFICSEIATKATFDERLMFCSETKFITHILLNKLKLGIVRGEKVRYKVSSEVVKQQAPIQDPTASWEWYMPVLDYFYRETIECCKNCLSHVPEFVQNVIAYDLQWKLRCSKVPNDILGENDSLFCQKTFELLEEINDEVILRLENISFAKKMFILSKKYHSVPNLINYGRDVLLCFQDTCRGRLSQCKFFLEFLEISAGTCRIEGHFELLLIPHTNIELVAIINRERFSCYPIHRFEKKLMFGEEIVEYYGFGLEFPLYRDKEKYSLKFMLLLDDKQVDLRNFTFGRYFPVTSKYKNAFFWKENWKVNVQHNQIHIISCGKRGHIKSEIRLLKELWKKNARGTRKAALARLAYHICKLLKRKPIWLVSDRVMKADDNGEAFFLYLQKEKKQISNPTLY